VNLAPIESGLAKLHAQHHELRDQVAEQNESLKKVEDQLQHVREATDRNTLEQQELLEDLKAVGTKVNIFAYLALALLGLSVALNIFLFVQLRHILH
jgi:chromosome segregation ATPase